MHIVKFQTTCVATSKTTCLYAFSARILTCIFEGPSACLTPDGVRNKHQTDTQTNSLVSHTMTSVPHVATASGGYPGIHNTKRLNQARPSAMSPRLLRAAPKVPVMAASRRTCLTVVANAASQGDAIPPPIVFNVSRSFPDCSRRFSHVNHVHLHVLTACIISHLPVSHRLSLPLQKRKRRRISVQH